MRDTNVKKHSGGFFPHFKPGLDSSGNQIENFFNPVKPEKLREELQRKLQPEYGALRVEVFITQNPDSIEAAIGEIHTLPMPVNFKDRSFSIATVHDYSFTLLKRILPQAALSIFIILLSLSSFLLLYRNLRAQQKITAQQRNFISNISHELKTPIATVSVALEALQNFHQLQNAEKTREYLSISQKEVGRLALLTDNVLRISLMEQGELKMQMEVLNLQDLVIESADAMRLQAEKSGGTLQVNLNPGNYQFHGDRLHLSGMLINLLDNAVKYSEGPPKVSISLDQSERDFRITVQDNGIGIRKEHQSDIYKKFYRVMQGNQHNVKGFGLGLSYVAEIVTRHKGKIELTSEFEKGSTFVVTLPLKSNG